MEEYILLDIFQGQKFNEKVGHYGIDGLFANAFSVYPEIAGAIPLEIYLSKRTKPRSTETSARLFPQVVTRSLIMLEARMRLFTRFRVKGFHPSRREAPRRDSLIVWFLVRVSDGPTPWAGYFYRRSSSLGERLVQSLKYRIQ